MTHAAHELLWTGFRGLDPAEVQLTFRPGGIILFARNLDPDPGQGPERCHALIQGLQSRWGSSLPLAVAIDQEGGAVSRLRPWVGETPSFRSIWEKGGAEACRHWGILWGQGCRLLGFNVDFAPVADLWDGHVGTGMGDRCASTAPESVAAAVGAFLNGLESQGVQGCLKHFPGLGGTRVDSHQSLPELEDPAQVARNLEPFVPLAHPGRLIMVAHLKTPHTEGLPASLHRGSVAGNPWGVQGRWLPDDLEMGGCAQWSWEDRVRLCLEAGQESLLVCQTPQGVDACAEAAAGMPEALWSPALARFRQFRAHLASLQGPFQRDAWKGWLEELRNTAKRYL
ncbi:MAG: Beta-hexosaminidase [Holophagaceae bacterium]|nr:Beta-hexosaminidase [Holophagaceae bacterium]